MPAPRPDRSAPAASVPADAVAVTASEYKFDPSTLSTKAGAVTFAVTNGGTTEHEFEIFQGDKVIDEIEGLTPGLTKSLTVTLTPGATPTSASSPATTSSA